MTPEIKTPKIKLFGDITLLALVKRSSSTIILPNQVNPDSAFALQVAALGDGERINSKLKVGDKVELLHPGGKPHMREFDGTTYMLVGLDLILGVIPE